MTDRYEHLSSLIAWGVGGFGLFLLALLVMIYVGLHHHTKG